MRSRRRGAGKGKRALAAELRSKGLDTDVIDAALDGIDAAAERVPGRATRGTSAAARDAGDADDTKVIRRLVGMLARRGYSQNMAVAVSDGLAAERERRRV